MHAAQRHQAIRRDGQQISASQLPDRVEPRIASFAEAARNLAADLTERIPEDLDEADPAGRQAGRIATPGIPPCSSILTYPGPPSIGSM